MGVTPFLGCQRGAGHDLDVGTLCRDPSADLTCRTDMDPIGAIPADGLFAMSWNGAPEAVTIDEG